MKTAERALQEALAVNPAHREAMKAGGVIRDKTLSFGFSVADEMEDRVKSLTLSKRYSQIRMMHDACPRVEEVAEERDKRDALLMRVRMGRYLVSELAHYFESVELEIRVASAD